MMLRLLGSGCPFFTFWRWRCLTSGRILARLQSIPYLSFFMVWGWRVWVCWRGGGNLRTSTDRKSTRLNSSHGYISYAGFFFNDTATTEIYTLSLHDALPISSHIYRSLWCGVGGFGFAGVEAETCGQV